MPTTVAKKLNGKKVPILYHPQVMEKLDGRYSFTRKMNRIYKLLKKQSKAESIAKDLLCRRAAFLAVQVETLECQALRSAEPVDERKIVYSTNALVAILRRLGFEDRSLPKKDLSTYIGALRPKPKPGSKLKWSD